MVPKSDHLANPRFDKKPSAQVALMLAAAAHLHSSRNSENTAPKAVSKEGEVTAEKG